MCGRKRRGGVGQWLGVSLESLKWEKETPLPLKAPSWFLRKMKKVDVTKFSDGKMGGECDKIREGGPLVVESKGEGKRPPLLASLDFGMCFSDHFT